MHNQNLPLLKNKQIIFGTSRLHHIFSNKKRDSLLKNALDLGINHFDTAPSYGNGFSEKQLGNFIKKNKNKKIIISTKFGIYSLLDFATNIYTVIFVKLFGYIFPYAKRDRFDYSVTNAKNSLSKSLNSLNLKKIDYYFIHEPKGIIKDYKELIEWLELMKKIGKIGNWGISGDKESILEWINYTNYVPPIIQAKIEKGNKINIEETKSNHYISYGLISNLVKPGNNEIEHVFKNFFRENKTHKLIISTTRSSHLKQISKISKVFCE